MCTEPICGLYGSYTEWTLVAVSVRECMIWHDQLKSSIMLESLVKMTWGFVLAQPLMGFGSFIYPISIMSWMNPYCHFSMVLHAEMVFQDDIVTSLTNLPWLGFWLGSHGWDSDLGLVVGILTIWWCSHVLILLIIIAGIFSWCGSDALMVEKLEI